MIPGVKTEWTAPTVRSTTAPCCRSASASRAPSARCSRISGWGRSMSRGCSRMFSPRSAAAFAVSASRSCSLPYRVTELQLSWSLIAPTSPSIRSVLHTARDSAPWPVSKFVLTSYMTPRPARPWPGPQGCPPLASVVPDMLLLLQSSSGRGIERGQIRSRRACRLCGCNRQDSSRKSQRKGLAHGRRISAIAVTHERLQLPPVLVRVTDSTGQDPR